MSPKVLHKNEKNQGAKIDQGAVRRACKRASQLLIDGAYLSYSFGRLVQLILGPTKFWNLHTSISGFGMGVCRYAKERASRVLDTVGR